ncbi:MAG: aminotransferase class I/II-fold pyridoxal phosphate-dependent enzyme [Candidatus Rifleibacteriota bacterium]
MFEEKFADRLKHLTPSPIRQMMAIAKELVAEGKTVYELNIGQPDIKCIPDFAKAINQRAATGQINYAPFIGEKYLRETYARYLNHYFDRRRVSHLVVDTENVLVTVGASHALSNAFLAICNPGDEILAIEPFFSPYHGFLSVAGGVLKTVPTKAEEGFALPSEEEIQKYITPKTKAILFNSPNNPSGKIFSKEEVERLARVALKNDLFIIGDEVYREMILGNEEAYSLLQVNFEDEETNEKFKNLLIVVDSASKSFSLCGVRIGFAIAKPDLVKKISLVNAHTVACVSDLLQYGVASAYDAVLSQPDYLENLRETYRTRLDATMEAIEEYLPNVVAPRPAGAFYIMIKFPELEDIDEFCHFMLEKFNLGGETVAVTPAHAFYQDPELGKNEIRVALVVSPEKMRRSIKIISEALKAYKIYKGNLTRPYL